MKANHCHSMKMKTPSPCTPIGGILFPNIMHPLQHPRDTHFPHMHGRPLESRRPPPERLHRPACSTAPVLPPAPHPRIRLPVLSVFVSLFSIDDTTLHLVAHPPAHSVLFPGSIRPSDEWTRNAQEVHGVLSLLEPSRQHAGLRDGLAVACDESILPYNPFKISPSPVIGLLGLVRGFVQAVPPYATWIDKAGTLMVIWVPFACHQKP